MRCNASWVPCALAGLLAIWCGEAVIAADGDPEIDVPLPINLKADPNIVVIGQPVNLTGKTVAFPTNDVSLSLSAAKSSPPQSAKLSGKARQDGTYQISYLPKVAGDYTAVVTAPDGRGTAQTLFHAVDPATLPPDLQVVLPKSIHDAGQITDQLITKIANLPPSPAKNKLSDGLQEAKKKIEALEPEVADLSNNLNFIFSANWMLQDPATQAKLQATQSEVIRDLGEVESWDLRSDALKKAIALGTVVCDNLEVVSEGVKWVGAMLGFFAEGPMDVIKGFGKDLVAGAIQDGVTEHTGSGVAGWAAGEYYKMRGTVEKVKVSGEGVVADSTHTKLDAGNAVGFLNDLVSAGVDFAVGQFCEVFSGPISGHMQAIFLHEGRSWWEYSYDVKGQITLHYPKGATGSGPVPLKGRIEGYATNYRLYEDALTILYPALMSSAVKTKLVIMPLEVPDIGLTNVLNNAEGSIASTAVTPGSFFYEITGTATETNLSIKIGPARTDADNKAARVITAYLSPLLAYGFEVYSLPYKPAHFLFERASPGSYELPIKTDKDAMTSEQGFHNNRPSANGEAIGDYTMKIRACNPAC